MDIRRLLLLIYTVLLVKNVFGMKHLVYWDKKLIPELQQDGLQVTVEIDDWMDVLCPYYADANGRATLSRADRLMIFNVTEYDFHSCDTRRGIRVQRCDSPLRETKLTTKFQRHSPSPFGFTFRPGATYYYISKPIEGEPSKGCTEHTLKMIVRVEKKGTVFDPTDRVTKVYHRQSKNHHNEKTSHSSSHEKDKKHHLHRSHSGTTTTKTKTTTSIPKKPIFQVINTSRDSSKSAQRKRDGPENGSFSLSRCASTFLLSIMCLAATWLLCLR